MRAALKRVALALFGEYEVFRIWRLDGAASAPSPALFDVRPLEDADFDAGGVPRELVASRQYLGEQASGFGCFDGGRLLGIAFYWWGERYAQRQSWPIEPQAAKLVQIVTAAEARGRGVATCLIRASAAAMQARGRAPLYARVWHSNTASSRAFARAGWRPCGWQLRLHPLGRAQPWLLQFGDKPPRR